LIALFVHDDAKADLLALRDSEPQAAGRILALLEQLEGDTDLLDRLTQHDYGTHHSADFQVSKWLEDKGLRYRIVYAFQPRKQHYHVLAIAPREFNYDTSHPISQRILRAYEEL
jgi:hypothetical protein